MHFLLVHDDVPTRNTHTHTHAYAHTQKGTTWCDGYKIKT